MRLSQLLGKTLREDPADAETASHRLSVRAGLIAPLAAGIYSILPLGWRVVRKIRRIIRDEMDAAGGQELHMPVLQPIEIWDETGRREKMGETLFRLKDRRGRELVLGPTHEEVITYLLRQNVSSYRDLPQRPYQIQTKFRDEPRPRAGLLRVREFDMKDMYSFDVDAEGLDLSYRRIVEAYRAVFSRCGLPSLEVEADSGAIGGKDSHEFILPADSGEDHILRCPSCGYAANQERAHSVKPEGPTLDTRLLPMEKVATAGAKTIQEISSLFGVRPSQTIKAVFYTIDGELCVVSIRGDLEVNEIKLKNLLGATDLRLATEAEAADAGLIAGSASLVGLDGIKTVADDSIRMGANFVVGANEPDAHYKNANYPRDFTADLVHDIANAEAGHRCVNCVSSLEGIRGIEVGHVFKLGTIFSDVIGTSYLDAAGVQQPVFMGSYGIGVGRLLAAAIEQNHDEAGIVWPVPIAPFQVHLVALGNNPEVGVAADHLYKQLQAAGLEVLYDDRDESAGVKFNDADLLGMPVRVTVSQRNLKEGVVELKRRASSDLSRIPETEIVVTLKEMLRDSNGAS